MARLTKAQARAHAQAEKVLELAELSAEQVDTVLECWREDARHVNGEAGAFFTPPGLARDLMIDLGEPARVIDLCAGIGTLALTVARHAANPFTARPLELVCVEANPDYVAVGRKLVPDATWITGSVFDVLDHPLVREMAPFDAVIANPPFGRVARDGSSPCYTGSEFEYHVIDIAAHLAPRSVMIIPTMSAPFRYSGAPCYRLETTPKLQRFQAAAPGIEIGHSCGIDTTFYREDWHGTSPQVEVVVIDNTAHQGAQQQPVRHPGGDIAAHQHRRGEPATGQGRPAA